MLISFLAYLISKYAYNSKSSTVHNGTATPHIYFIKRSEIYEKISSIRKPWFLTKKKNIYLGHLHSEQKHVSFLLKPSLEEKKKLIVTGDTYT